jgi:tyrosine-specific transport protein
MKKHSLHAIATLVGCTIGAGILGIPYVVAKSGFLVGLIDLLVIGIAIIFLNLFVGEITLRTKEVHQLTGYAEKYLGINGKRLMSITMIFGNYSALTAYLIGTGQALFILFGIFSAFHFSLIYLAIMAILLYGSLELFENSELVFGSITLALILFIIGFAVFSNSFNSANLQYYDLSKVFLPYGVILFAFLGAISVPEMREELKNEKKSLKKCIIIGGLIPLVIYILFTLTVIGVDGVNTTQVATTGLGNVLGYKMILLTSIFAVINMTTSFLAIGLGLRCMYSYDFKLNKNLSWLLVWAVPLFAFSLGINNFIGVLGIAGALAGGIEGILIVLMYYEAKKKGDRKPEYSLNLPRFLGAFLTIFFVAGIAYTILSLSHVI